MNQNRLTPGFNLVDRKRRRDEDKSEEQSTERLKRAKTEHKTVTAAEQAVRNDKEHHETATSVWGEERLEQKETKQQQENRDYKMCGICFEDSDCIATGLCPCNAQACVPCWRNYADSTMRAEFGFDGKLEASISVKSCFACKTGTRVDPFLREISPLPDSVYREKCGIIRDASFACSACKTHIGPNNYAYVLHLLRDCEERYLACPFEAVQHDTCQGIRLPRWSPDLWQADNMATLTEIFKRHVVSGECTAISHCTYNEAQWGGQDKECGAVCGGLGMRFHMILAHAEAEASERVLRAVKVVEGLSYNTELKECKSGTGIVGRSQQEICRLKRRMVEANACWEHEMKKSADAAMSSQPVDDESEDDDSDNDAASTHDDLTADPDYDSDDQDDLSSSEEEDNASSSDDSSEAATADNSEAEASEPSGTRRQRPVRRSRGRRIQRFDPSA
jgi:hypothetical protein